MPDDRIPEMDDQTRAALLLFNQHLAAEAEAEAESRRLRKAEQAKNDSAAQLRKLQEAKAPAEEVAEAEAAYRTAVDRWTRMRDGLPEEEPSDAPTPPASEAEPEPEAEAAEPEAGEAQATEPEAGEAQAGEPEPEAGEAQATEPEPGQPEPGAEAEATEQAT